jgi:lysophospholipase L1-like esterase
MFSIMKCKPLFAWFAAGVAVASFLFGADAAPLPFGDKVRLRGSFENARITFERTGKGSVAFLGGSITEMNGYRPMVCEILQKRFPKTVFTFISAGISSTCSTTGAFRLGADVLAQGPVDLLFVEFAVNDDQDAHHTRAECVRGMEGILRHARQSNPNMDIVMTFFVNESILKTLQEGKAPLTIEAHEAVAEYYGVPTVNLAKEVAEEIAAGTLTWQKFGGVHPAPFGNAIVAQMIDQLFSRAWAAPLAKEAAVSPRLIPLTPLDPLSYAGGRFIDPKEAKLKQGWTLGVPEWKSLAGGKRERFTSLPMLCATEAGAEATLAFEGTAVGAFVVAGPDAGIAEASIDGGPYCPVDLYHAYSKGLHYPRTVMLGTGLQPGPHTLTLRISAATTSAGHAMRIMRFVAN